MTKCSKCPKCGEEIVPSKMKFKVTGKSKVQNKQATHNMQVEAPWCPCGHIGLTDDMAAEMIKKFKRKEPGLLPKKGKKRRVLKKVKASD